MTTERMRNMRGMKAEIKAALKAKGYKEIVRDDGRHIKLANAKTSDLLRVLTAVEKRG